MLGSLHNLERLIVFTAAVEGRSLSRAAERLLLTQPGVCGHIKALEDGRGVRLLARGHKGTVLTEPSALLETISSHVVAPKDE